MATDIINIVMKKINTPYAEIADAEGIEELRQQCLELFGKDLEIIVTMYRED